MSRISPALALCALALIITMGCSPARVHDRTGEVWFDNLQGSPLVSPEQQRAMVRQYARRILHRGTNRGNAPTPDGPADPSIVFVSVSDGESAAKVAHAGRWHAESAVWAATDKALAFAGEAGYRPRWVRVDFVRGVTAPATVSASRGLTLPPESWGIAFPRGSQIAFLPEELYAHRLVAPEGALQPARVLSYLNSLNGPTARARDLFTLGRFSVYRFATRGYFYAKGTEHGVTSLHNGHRRVASIKPEMLLSSAIAGGQYLTRSTAESGRFDYIYNPATAEVPDVYNMVRHAGTVYAMYELHAAQPDPELLGAANRALGFLLKNIHPARQPGQAGQCLVWDGNVKLGSNALAVLAMVEHHRTTGKRTHLKTAADLAKWMVSVQLKNGRFGVHKQSHPGGEAAEFRSSYYPGEAIFALSRLYAADGNRRWLDSAAEAAEYLITERDRGKAPAELPPDHWLLYGLNELHRAAPQDIYISHVAKLAMASDGHAYGGFVCGLPSAAGPRQKAYR